MKVIAKLSEEELDLLKRIECTTLQNRGLIISIKDNHHKIAKVLERRKLINISQYWRSDEYLILIKL